MSTDVSTRENLELTGAALEAAAADDFQYHPVPKSHQKRWFDITFAWFGAAMVAQLYQAGVTVTIGTGGSPTA